MDQVALSCFCNLQQLCIVFIFPNLRISQALFDSEGLLRRGKIGFQKCRASATEFS